MTARLDCTAAAHPSSWTLTTPTFMDCKNLVQEHGWRYKTNATQLKDLIQEMVYTTVTLTSSMLFTTCMGVS